MKPSNIEAVKKCTKNLAEIIKVNSIPIAGAELLTNHPFVDSVIWYNRWIKLQKENPNLEHAQILTLDTESQNDFTKLIDLRNEDIYKEWLKEFYEYVDEIDKLCLVYNLWRDPYKLLFVKLNENALNEKDLAEYLADAWVTEDNPNMDNNVSRKEALSLFKKCNKKYLMTEEDYKYYVNLPKEITIYRGVGKGRIEKGLSWTDNKDKAEWFMNRWKDFNNGEGKMLKARVNKRNVIAYFNTRGEQEILLDVFACAKQIERIL